MKHVYRTSLSIAYEAIGFFNLPNHTRRTKALGFTQPLIEMSTKNIPGGKARPARKADNFPDVFSRLSS
jgi:hypothetical protein